MNYSKNEVKKRQRRLRSTSMKIYSKLKFWTLRLFVITLVTVVLAGGYAGWGLLNGILDTCPEIHSEDIQPEKFASTLYDNQNKKIGKLIGSEANRTFVSLDKIPLQLQNAFIAIEDERFRSHNGIDMKGIFRAAFSSLSSGGLGQGASTITQQLIKNVVFEGGMETNQADKLKRKVQEQYLALELEKKVDKDTILENYLNTINLGQNTLGVQAASERYFNKSVSKLTLSECCVIAGITKNPSALNPISYPENNKQRRLNVLNKMLELNFITQEEYDEALDDNVYSRIKKINQKKGNLSITSYFTDALIDQVLKDLQTELNLSKEEASNLLYRGGLKIYTTQDSSMQKICDSIINNPANYPISTQYGLSYRLSFRDKKDVLHNYDEKSLKEYFQSTDAGFDLLFSDKISAKRYVKKYKKHLLNTLGGTVDGENVSYPLEPQLSFVLMDQHTGEVKALVGGRGDKLASRTLNRASSTTRQPGSTFKVLSAFLPALDNANMTLATTFDDAPFAYPGTNRLVKNWYRTSYRGLSSIRDAIKNSMNVVTVKTMQEVTPEVSISYLKNLDFSTLVTDASLPANDVNLSTALGGLTYGVTNLEATAAYASIANKGTYQEPILYTKIVDYTGNVLINREPKYKKVFQESTAFLLTSAMQDVVTSGTGTLAKFTSTNMPVAGKTGTTSDNVDAWFIGYTPYYTAGIWTGYDDNTSLSNTSYHKTIWKTIMERIHADLPVKEFDKCDSIVSARICSKSGKLARSGLCDCACGGSTVRTEYFAEHAPTEYCDSHISVNICSISGQPASNNCPKDCIKKVVFLKKDETGSTLDTPNCISSSRLNSTCKVHTSNTEDKKNSKKSKAKKDDNASPFEQISNIPDIEVIPDIKDLDNKKKSIFEQTSE